MSAAQRHPDRSGGLRRASEGITVASVIGYSEGVSTTLYPLGYGSTLVTMRRLRELHEPRMHPTYAAALFAWIESKGGLIGIGGGWRSTQPALPGFAPDGMSFHQDQTFASGFVGFSAVDLVKRNPAGGNHVSPAWADSADAPNFGLHTFIKSPTPEPWHMQAQNIRGYSTWIANGRPDPVTNYTPPIPPPPPPHQGVPVTTTKTDWLVPGERILDSRWWDEAGRFGDDMPNDNGVRTIPCAKAAGAGAVTITVTAVSPKGAGFVTLFTDGVTPPTVSALNYAIGQTAIANSTTVPVKADGSFQVYCSANTHLVIDLIGIHRV